MADFLFGLSSYNDSALITRLILPATREGTKTLYHEGKMAKAAAGLPVTMQLLTGSIITCIVDSVICAEQNSKGNCITWQTGDVAPVEKPEKGLIFFPD